MFISNRFPGTSITPLRFAAGSLLLVFSLGSDFERTKTLLSFSFKLLRTEKQYDILADVYKTNPHFKIDSFSLHPIKFGYYHLIWTKIDYNNFCEKIYKHD